MNDILATANALPIWEQRDEILQAIGRHQVVVLEGPTGCGKTTQIPRMLWEAGLTDQVIGVTQPRRIAAVGVAMRIAAEMGVKPGGLVGHSIRFDDMTSASTRIKIMTDGILLQEVRTQPDFDGYGLIVVDEAHERTLNIDITLGLLHRALLRRVDLRVIVSSATLDPGRFQAFFADHGMDVPLLSIRARPFPVRHVWQPVRSDDPRDIAEAVANEIAYIHCKKGEGHVLAFLSGEAGIRQATEALERQGIGRDAEIMGLYGALPREEQERIFSRGDGRRRIVLATNIAETSITVPGVCFVVDSGLAKVPRVDPVTGVRALREEGISQASANQRAGRAGRTAPGTAVHLYSERWLAGQPRFADEEILREDLREVVLRLIDLGVHDIESFPLPTRPPMRRLETALRQLRAMGAIDDERQLTAVGRRMTPFPLSPPLARMVIEAADRFPDVVEEVLMVAAWLGSRRPQRFPTGEEDEAREAHKAFHHPLGDALAAITTLKRFRASGDPVAFCERYFLDPATMAYIDSATLQLGDIARGMGVEVSGGGDPAGVIRCVAAGFADNILAIQGREWVGPGDETFAIHPASVLFGTRNRFLVAAEIIVLRRPYASQVSVLRPEWLLEVAPELARRLNLRAPKERLGRKGEIDPATLPTHVEIDDLRLPIVVRRGRVQVDVPWELVDALRRADPRAIPADAARLKSRVLVGEHAFAVGTPLGSLARLLPHLPLPGPDDDLRCRVPEGALLEADRNLHAILRHLDDLLCPMLPSHGRRAGWAMLVANGVGSFWFEVVSDFREALQVTLLSLEDLAETLGDDAALQAELNPRIARLAELQEQVDAAWKQGKQKKQRRGGH